jgi:predicted molibdopterin-dependent oxidoreductase YjgC
MFFLKEIIKEINIIQFKCNRKSIVLLAKNTINNISMIILDKLSRTEWSTNFVSHCMRKWKRHV